MIDLGYACNGTGKAKDLKFQAYLTGCDMDLHIFDKVIGRRTEYKQVVEELFRDGNRSGGCGGYFRWDMIDGIG